MALRFKNSMELQLEEFVTAWDVFTAQCSKPVLALWKFPANELPLFEAFLGREDSEDGEIPALFEIMAEPFVAPSIWNDELCTLFTTLQKEWSEAFPDETPTWECPRAGVDASSAAAILDSFCTAHGESFDHCAIVISPSSGIDEPEWLEWIYALISVKHHPKVRFILFDFGFVDYSQLAESPRVFTETINVNSNSAIADLLPNNNEPGTQYRRYLLALFDAVGEGNLANAQVNAESALIITGAQNWPLLSATVRFALASGYMMVQRYDDAISEYESARADCQKAINMGDESAPKINLNAALGAGAAAISGEDWEVAVSWYELAEKESEALGDIPMVILTLHLQATCWVQLKKHENAWNCAATALEHGDSIESDKRVDTSLKPAGELLMRLTKKWSLRKHRKDVDERMTELLGIEWDYDPKKKRER